MVPTDVFLDAIFLLINDNSPANQNVVDGLIAAHLAATKNAPPSPDTDLAKFYVKILKAIIQDDIDRSDENALRAFLLKFKSDPALERHRDVADLLQDAFMSRQTMDMDKLEKLLKRCQVQLLTIQVDRMVKGWFGNIARSKDLTDPDDQMREIQKIIDRVPEMGTLVKNSAGAIVGEGVDCINFGDRDSMRVAMKKHTQRNVSGLIRTGLQGLNRALGKAGAFVGGESIFFSALPHMYKSGMLMSVALWTMLYNVPDTSLPGKNMIYLGSLENEAFQNMVWMIKKAYRQLTGESPDLLSEDALIDWMVDIYEQRGFHLVIERHLPQNFGAREFEARIEHYESLGYRVRIAIIDYVNLMSKTNSADPKASEGARDLAVRFLVSRLCNYTKNKGITFVSAHPLNSKAMDLVASNQTNVVKKFADAHLADSKDVAREVDVHIFLHLEVNDAGEKFLTAKLVKHRYVDDTPESHKYFAYRFTEGIGIVDDIDGPAQFVTNIFASDFSEAPMDLSSPANNNHQSAANSNATMANKNADLAF